MDKHIDGSGRYQSRSVILCITGCNDSNLTNIYSGWICFRFLLLIIHEWLHGIVYPKEADVTIGRIKGKTTFVALASYPLKRNRFILMCLLPFVLGLVPFILFVISPAEFRVFNGLNFGMACMGMVSPFPDVFNVLVVLRNSEKSDSIMFHKNDMYKIS